MTIVSYLDHLKQEAEAAYDRMYDAATRGAVDDCYRTAKENLREAIALARQLGLPDEEKVLVERLYHIKMVYRNQFAP